MAVVENVMKKGIENETGVINKLNKDQILLTRTVEKCKFILWAVFAMLV